MPSAFPVFFDVDVVGGRPLPIEVGWAFVGDDQKSVISESYFVKPEEWKAGNDWGHSEDQETRISDVLTAGRSVVQIARRLNVALADRNVFADDPFDEEWLIGMYDAVGVEPSFKIRRLLAKMLVQKCADVLGMSSTAFSRLQGAVERAGPRTQNAEANARHLALLWLTVTQTTNSMG